jgi:putative flippase GtrA
MKQFIKFGIVGVSNTLVSYAVYSASLLLLKKIGAFPSREYILAQFIAFLLSVLLSYYWNQKKVFVLEKGEKRSKWKALVKTYISYAFTGLFLSTVLLHVWITYFRISDLIAPIINLLFTVPLNFVINKYWAFKSDERT